MNLNLRIDWSELDLFGHVNNVAFFKYIQSSRVNYWDQLGIMHMHAQDGTGCMLASCSCTFVKPLFFPGEVTIRVSVEFIRNSSFGFHHRLYNAQQELVAEAHDVIVLYDFNKHEKVLIPDGLRKQLESNLQADQGAQ